MRKTALLVVAAFGLAGCAGMNYAAQAHGPYGIYSGTKANTAVSDANIASTKTGQACSSSILGIVTTGDASVPTAAKAGGIKKIASVDNTFMQVLGVYAQYCTVVTGE
jgi:hypothetical protein